METSLIVEARRGVDRVVLEFDPGQREEAFEIFCRALPAIQTLDQVLRRKGSASQAAGVVSNQADHSGD